MAASLQDYEAQTLLRWNLRRMRVSIRIDQRIDQVLHQTHMTVGNRVRLAGQLLRDMVVANLARPVRKLKKSRILKTTNTVGDVTSKKENYTVVDPASRSKPGQFPRADTTRLMKSIYMRFDAETATATVGTPLKYGYVLEFKRNRSFLRRTFNEMRDRILRLVRGGE